MKRKPSQKDIVIHVGYPKSASTTLQKHLFNKHPEIYNLGLFPTANIGRDSDYIDESCEYLSNPNLRKFYDNLVMLESVEYDNSNQEKLYENHIENLLENSEEKVTVFSNERFVSVFYAHDDLGIKAERLKEIFPDAKILFVLRSQIDLIKSQYRDHPFDPRSFAIGKPLSIDEWIQVALEAEEVHFLESLRYSDVIGYYADLFGEEDIGVFLLEDLAQNTEGFAKDVSEFLNIGAKETLSLLQEESENKGVSSHFNTYRRLKRWFLSTVKIGKLFPEFLKKTFKEGERYISNLAKRGGEKEKLELSAESTNLLQEFYSDSNLNLEKRYCSQIDKYDYPTD